MNLLQSFLPSLLFCLLSGCGSGGGGSTPQATAPQTQPAASQAAKGTDPVVATPAQAEAAPAAPTQAQAVSDPATPVAVPVPPPLSGPTASSPDPAAPATTPVDSSGSSGTGGTVVGGTEPEPAPVVPPVVTAPAAEPECTLWTNYGDEPVGFPRCLSREPRTCGGYTTRDRAPDGREATPFGSLASKLYCVPAANNGQLNPGCICVA